MNYAPNTTHWPKGALVIHDADAKRANMLMVVVGFARDGRVKTRYLDTAQPRNLWFNDLRYLHDPARFGIAVPGKEGTDGTRTA